MNTNPTPTRRIETWLFDLDGTLYPENNGLLGALVERIIAYTSKASGLKGQAAHDLAHHYHRTYGNTLGGLMRHHGVDPRHFLTMFRCMTISLTAINGCAPCCKTFPVGS